MFSPQQDVEVGQQVAQDAERQLPLLNNSRVDNYVTVDRPDGLLFLVFTAPERDFRNYESAFNQMLRSVRVRR